MLIFGYFQEKEITSKPEETQKLPVESKPAESKPVESKPVEPAKPLQSSKSFDHAAQVEHVYKTGKARAPAAPVHIPEVSALHDEEPRRTVAKAPSLPTNLVKSAKQYEDSKPSNLG